LRKTVFEIVFAALEELEKLKPTPQEIQDYADLNQDAHGVVTYSKSKGGDYYFLRLHDTLHGPLKRKLAGHVHIDIGYVDEKFVNDWNVHDTTHLMLDKNHAPDFVNFVKKKRGLAFLRFSLVLYTIFQAASKRVCCQLSPAQKAKDRVSLRW
jgi:hypothetical protein